MVGICRIRYEAKKHKKELVDAADLKNIQDISTRNKKGVNNIG